MCQNLYLACSALGLGTCGIAAVDNPSFNKAFQVDGEEEFGIYAAPVGTIDEKNQDAENAFYNHIKEQGL
jgi:nitroreductase